MRWGDGNDRWRALAELGLAAGGALACWLWPQAGGWPLLAGLLPWLVRLAGRHFPFQRTSLDAPLGMFLASALVGVWATYDRPGGWTKFWLIAGGVLVFYALVRQAREHLPLVGALLGLCASVIALYFLLTQDWTTYPADLEVLNRFGTWWMKVRPNLSGAALHPNIAAGLMAFFTPFGVATLLFAFRGKRPWMGWYSTLTLSLSLTGLVMSSSRAAWFALTIALVLWGIWTSSRKLSPPRGGLARLWISLAILLFIGSTLLWRSPGLVLAGLNLLPGSHSATSRLEIFRDGFRLVRDFAFTGGGLQSFPGLYAHYMRVIRVFLFGYAHNLFLDMAIEQGLLGLGAWITLLSASGWMLLKNRDERLWSGATLSSLIVLILHGLADDPLYAQRGTPFLFLIPALALTLSDSQKAGGSAPPLSIRKPWLVWAGVSLGLSGTFLMVITRGRWLSAWEANLGAVYMARVELRGFPQEGWDETNRLPELKSARRLLEGALERDANNITALYRLGSIAMEQGDFTSARTLLEGAYTFDAGHRGVRKRLGYVYAWNGDLEQAAQMLVSIPEAGQELEVYAWWWQTQGREDLSTFARQTLNILTSASP